MFQERPMGVRVPPEIAKALGSNVPGLLSAIGATAATGNRHYDFSSDSGWTVTLNRDFVALTTRRYMRWEDFRGRLVKVIDALRAEYSPSFYIRIGLRYRNLIKRAEWGLEDVSWADLLEPHIAGPLSSAGVVSAIDRVGSEVTIGLDAGKVTLKHGLAAATKGAAPNSYVIDSDFFLEGRTEIDDGLDKLDHFNREARRLFRWAIKDRLHEAMGPESI